MATAGAVKRIPHDRNGAPAIVSDGEAVPAGVQEADTELTEVSARALRLLRAQEPGLFDSRGRLRKRALRRFLLKRAGGKAHLTRADVVALAGTTTIPADAVS